VNSRLVKSEANRLVKELSPILALGEPFRDFILWDVAKVIQICGRSHGDAGPNQLLAFLVVYGLVKQDTRRLQMAVQQWERSPDQRKIVEKEALALLLEITNHTMQDDRLVLPSILNRYDEEQGSNLLGTAVNAIYRFAQVVIKAGGPSNLQEMEGLTLIWKLLHTYQNLGNYEETVAALAQGTAAVAPSSANVMGELNDLVGMENIKQEVKTLANLLKIQKLRVERGLAKTPVSLHAVFCGPPGTGKTTVARLLGKIYKDLGFLAKGHLVETDRAGMVAGYVGQTSKRVDELVNSALDGVLFIDEAYTLKPKGASHDFGQEAIDILLKRMEDYRDRLVVIVAGYTEEMTSFIESNPGLKSRFNRYFYFNDYTPEELLAIFIKIAGKSRFTITPEAREKLCDIFYDAYSGRDRTFGNARLARNLFEKIVEQQANRLAVITNPSDEVLTTVLLEDIPTDWIDWDDHISSTPHQTHQTHSPTYQIATHLNQSLQPLGITARTNLRHTCLQVLLEADQIPDEPVMVAFVQDELLDLPPDGSITRIAIYARHPGEDFPVWSHEFDWNPDTLEN
jgi:AAA+ superfamily predicted ATPase